MRAHIHAEDLRRTRVVADGDVERALLVVVQKRSAHRQTAVQCAYASTAGDGIARIVQVEPAVNGVRWKQRRRLTGLVELLAQRFGARIAVAESKELDDVAHEIGLELPGDRIDSIHGGHASYPGPRLGPVRHQPGKR